MRSDQHHRLPCPFLYRRLRLLHRTALLPNRRPCQRTTRQTKNQPNSQQFHLSSRTTVLFLRAETNTSRPILLSNLTVRRFASLNSILIWRASAAKCLQLPATRRICFTDFLNGRDVEDLERAVAASSLSRKIKSPFLCQTSHEHRIPRRISIRAWLAQFGVDPCDA